jgi:CRP-like cAMP-binding protein
MVEANLGKDCLMSRKKCITAYVGEGRGEIKHLLLGEIQCVPQLFSALSETLHNQLKLVTNEKHEMTEEAHRLMKTIKQMEARQGGPTMAIIKSLNLLHSLSASRISSRYDRPTFEMSRL